jgi:nucleotide-binding universal stress UspA family protein
VYFSWRLAPKENAEHTAKHGAGQIALLAAVALFGVDFFTSFYYGTGELMSALHPLGLQNKAYIAVAAVAFVNLVLGGLYMFSLGIFHDGGGSYTASMRYLWPTLSLVVAVTLIQDYVLTIVVSALSGGDQLLSILNLYGGNWIWHFLIGAGLATITWFLTIKGRGESAKVVFTLLGIFAFLTVIMAGGLFYAKAQGISALPESPHAPVSLGTAIFHLIIASMKGMVALTGLEAVSNGIQFMIDEDVSLVKWGKKKLPKLNKLWKFYSGKVGIARFVQTSFLFYGGLGTLFLSYFSIHFNVFDGTLGRTLVGNLAFIGFSQIPSGVILYWAYQILAVALLAAASMTAFQDAQATEWRDVSIGVVPEVIIKRDAKGTFTRSVTITFIIAVIIMFLVKGSTTVAIPFYGIGVFMPISIMALSIRKHILLNYKGHKRVYYSLAATLAAVLAFTIFILQFVAKWHEGGWVALVGFTTLGIVAHLALMSKIGKRDPDQILRIVRLKARVNGHMGAIVEWQAFRMQMYRQQLLALVHKILTFLKLKKNGKHILAKNEHPISGGVVTISGESSSGVSLILYDLYNNSYTKSHGKKNIPLIFHGKRPTSDYSVLMLAQNKNEAKDLPKLAAPIAKSNKGEIYAVHVLEVPSKMAPANIMKTFKHDEHILKTAIDSSSNLNVPVSSSFRLGTTYDKAVQTISYEMNANLLLLKAPFHPNFGPQLFGKDIDSIIHNPPADLAMIYYEGKLPPIKKILIPTTGSENSIFAVEIAISLARGLKEHVNIEVIHIAEPGESSDKNLKKLMEYNDVSVKGQGYSMTGKIVPAKDVVGAILEEEKSYDLIIIGATNENLFENLLLGSVAERLARKSSIPFMIVRRKSKVVKSILKRNIFDKYTPATRNPKGYKSNSKPNINYLVKNKGTS